MGLGLQSAFQIIPKVFSEVQLWALCVLVKVLLQTEYTMDLSVHRGIVMLEQKGTPSQTFATRLESQNFLEHWLLRNL